MASWRTLRIGVAVSMLVLSTSSEIGAQILNAKRGFADYTASYDYIKATGAAWYYTWSLDDANVGNYDADFYPMFKHGFDVTTGNINNVKNRNPEYVLGFNEPERADQGNTTVAAAVTEWNQLYGELSGTDIKLVSPAVSDTGEGQAWINSFMSQMASKVDVVAFHWYGASTPDDPAGAAASFMSRVNHYKGWGKPVFITEFAIHDWGGNYTDAEITEANRQFLNIVLPQLDSDPNVLGYAWYPWFNDARIFDTSNPPKPTPMGYRYVGAVGTGQVANIGGQNLGEHAAYLTGGELTMTGTTAGTIRYINVLDNTSTISGTMDWSLAGTTPWVRIQPDTIVRKSGTNQITFGAGSVTNNGLLEVAQGTLRIGVSATGSGGVRIKGGTLALFGAGRLTTAPLIDVRAVGLLDVSALGNSFNVTNGQTLNVDRNGTVAGNVTAAIGSTVTGGGTFAGNLTALAGSTVRVGKDGAGVATRFVIDNFESYALGDVRTTASPPWTAHQDTSLADIENYSGNKVLTYGWAGGIRGLSRSMPEAAIIENDETATLFFRVNSKTSDPDHNFGPADQATTGTGDFGDFEAQLRMRQGTPAGTFAIDARNGANFTSILSDGLALNTWYNIWMVVDQTTDRYDIYMNTGTGDAIAANKLNASPLAFRNLTTNPLNTILGLANTAPIDNGVRIDDVVFLAGFDLTNPVAGFDPGLAWAAETLSVTGNYTQVNGATLQMNLLDPDHHDVLNVTGQANIGGTLNVSFAVGAPSPAAGDAFDILDFTLLSGIFNAVVLPTLGAGLVWDNSLLLSDGILAIEAGLLGDFNDDGNVDAADYVAWRDTLGAVGAGLAADANADMRVDQSDYTLWRANFGATLAGSSASSGNGSYVPEPHALMLAVLWMGAAGFTSATRRRV